MKLKLCLSEWKYHDNQCKNLLYWYTNKYYNIYFYNYDMGKKNNIWAFIKKQSFNLHDPLEKQLAIIYSFYEILNGVEEDIFWYLYYTVIWSKRQEFEIYWCEDCWEYWVWRNDYNDMDEVVFECNIHQLSELHIPPIPEWKLNMNEFYLLMQIYLGLYKEDTLKEQLEENEKKWKYDEVKEKWFYEDTWIDIEIIIEYLKLELMRKDTSWAFEWLEIEKIYDKDWSEEKQRKYIDEINKEFGEDVIVKE